MKNSILFSFIMAMCLVIGKAQSPPPVPNGLFSEWDSLPGGAEDPRYYLSINEASMMQGNREVIRRTTDAHTGDYALEITPLISPDTNTFLTASVVMGTPDIDTANLAVALNGGLTYKHTFYITPPPLYFYYKFIPSTLSIDSVFVVCQTFQYNAGSDSMELTTHSMESLPPYSDYHLGASSTSGWSIWINVDSISISFHYKSNNTSTAPTGKFIIDSLSFIYPGNISVTNNIPDADFRIFPNPFSDYLQLEAGQGQFEIEFTDMNGRNIYRQRVSAGQRIENLNLPAGNYIARLYDENGKMIKVQKMTTVR
jgi:hypothetical protein